MAKVTVNFENGDEVEYSSKKEMLQEVGRQILASSSDSMTLRQLYYRFVAMDLLDNKQSQYQYLGESIKEARIEGKIPWSWIEDRTRSIEGGDYDYMSPQERFDRNLEWFKNSPDRHNKPRWQGQDTYIEVWVEKEALAGVFASACEDLKVVTFPNRGYTSITLLKQAADRIRENAEEVGKEAYILYFGDFDPSGQDIERNIRDKLQSTFGIQVHVDRKALTKTQINKFQLPPQPAKSTDSRYEDFVAKHGNMAVELDALPPDELTDLIRESVEDYFDEVHYENKILPQQRREREKLQKKIDRVIDDGN